MNKEFCIRSKDFTIQMSLFLYLLNMATIIRISYSEKSNRVQSRSCHISLIKLDIVALKLESMKSLYPCFSHDIGEIGLNSYKKPLSFALPNTIVF